MFRTAYKCVCLLLLCGVTALPGASSNITLVNVDFAHCTFVKVGPAAAGLSRNDYWNGYTAPYAKKGGIADLKMADGTPSSVGFVLYNGPGLYDWQHPDWMLNTYSYAPRGESMDLAITNLAAGAYDIWLYGRGNDPEGNSVFSLSAEGRDYGTKATRVAENWTAIWDEDLQYVVYRDVVIPANGGSVHVHVSPGKAGYAMLNGLQIMSRPEAPAFCTQPLNWMVQAGQGFTLHADAHSASPISYSWFKDGVPLETASEKSLQFASVNLTQQGSYQVLASNALGHAFSSNALVTVTPPLPEAFLLNLDFGCLWYAKTGHAATGCSIADYWNCNSGHSATSGTANLRLADGTVTGIGFLLQNGAGCKFLKIDDPMMDTYSFSEEPGPMVLSLTNFPAGTFNVYLYGHGPTDSENSVFTLYVGPRPYGNQGNTADGSWRNPCWVQNAQYVVFTNVVVPTNGGQITVQVDRGAAGNNPFAGLQVSTLPVNSVLPPAGLLSLWRGEENTRDYFQCADGLPAVMEYAPGKIGQAFSFHLNTVPVKIPACTNLSAAAFTFSAWVKPAALAVATDRLFVFGQPAGLAHLFLRPGPSGFKVGFGFNSTNAAAPVEAISNQEIPAGTFTHIAGSWDGSVLRTFINGHLAAEQNSAQSPALSSLPFFIGGADSADGTRAARFSGLIDEVGVYGRALSELEVRTLANYTNIFLNRPPRPAAYTLMASQDAPCNLPAGALLAACSDPDGDSLVLGRVDPVSTNGARIVFTDSSILYTPRPGFVGADSFAYSVLDSYGKCSRGTVLVRVSPRQSPPHRVCSVNPVPGGLEVIMEGLPNLKYQLERGRSENGPWTPVILLTTGSDGRASYIDPHGPDLGEHYRVSAPAISN